MNIKDYFTKFISWLKILNKAQTYIFVIAVLSCAFFIESLISDLSNVSNKIKKLEEQNIQYREEIRQNRIQYDSIVVQIKEKDDRISLLEQNEEELSDMYGDVYNKLENLRTKYEKINSIDKFNSADIKRYFSDNYSK